MSARVWRVWIVDALLTIAIFGALFAALIFGPGFMP